SSLSCTRSTRAEALPFSMACVTFECLFPNMLLHPFYAFRVYVFHREPAACRSAPSAGSALRKDPGSRREYLSLKDIIGQTTRNVNRKMKKSAKRNFADKNLGKTDEKSSLARQSGIARRHGKDECRRAEQARFDRVVRDDNGSAPC